MKNLIKKINVLNIFYLNNSEQTFYRSMHVADLPRINMTFMFLLKKHKQYQCLLIQLLFSWIVVQTPIQFQFKS